MIRHHQKKRNMPAVDFLIMFCGLDQGGGCFRFRETDVSTLRCANRKKINRAIRNPQGHFMGKLLSFGQTHEKNEANDWVIFQ